jgi:sigma-B regulation protein RsbQ
MTWELTESFLRIDPVIFRQFARVAFLSDLRADLPSCPVPTLVVQCADDLIAPICVGQYLHRALPRSRYVLLDTVGHCPHLTIPAETANAIRTFLSEAI